MRSIRCSRCWPWCWPALRAGRANRRAWFSSRIVPYAAFAVLLVGFCCRVVRWASAPVPFHIPVTCGQQKSLPWIRPAKVRQPLDRMGRCVPHGRRNSAFPFALSQQPRAPFRRTPDSGRERGSLALFSGLSLGIAADPAPPSAPVPRAGAGIRQRSRSPRRLFPNRRAATLSL